MKRLRELQDTSEQQPQRQDQLQYGAPNPYQNISGEEKRQGSLSRVQMKGNAGNYNNILSAKSQRSGSQNTSKERQPAQLSDVYYAQSPQKQRPEAMQNAEVAQSNIDFSRQPLDSRIILAQQTGQQPLLLETLSSNESRYTSSPNFLARSKESFNPSHFAGGVNSSLQGGTQMLGNAFNGASVSSSLAKDYSLGGRPNQAGMGGGYHGTQVINVPTLGGGSKNNYFESISYSASSEFGHHSLRSSIEQSNSARGYSQMADQIRLEQYQVKKYQNPVAILEESKEEDVSFNKSLTAASQSPIPVRRLADGTAAGGFYGSGVAMSAEMNLTGTEGGIPFGGGGRTYMDNKSSIDDGTRSLLMHMRGFQALDSQEHSATLGSQALRNTQVLGGGQAPKPNFNISSGSNGDNFLKFMGTTTPQKSATQFVNPQKYVQMRDQELLEELGQASSQDPRASTQQQQQLLSSLQVSDELLGSAAHKYGNSSSQHFRRTSEGEDFNAMDDMASGRAEQQQYNFTSGEKGATISGSGEVRDSELKMATVSGQEEKPEHSYEGDGNQYSNNNYSNQGLSQLVYDQQQQRYQQQTRNVQAQRANDPIRIDDNQFVTLNQVEGGASYSPYYGGGHRRVQDYSGRPSNTSQYAGPAGQYQNYQNYSNVYGAGQSYGPFSDGQSSSNPTSQMNTPHQNQFQSRTVSPYPFTRREISNLSQSSQKCQCCQAPIPCQNHYRPLSGLSQIETKELNYYDKGAEEQEVQTPKLESEVDQSTKMISNKETEKVSSYKAVLCLDCQSRMLGKENFTPIAPSDLKSSELTTSNLVMKQSQMRNFDDVNSNLSSIHQQSNNLASSSMQPYSQQHPTASQFNQLKFSSSLMGQSELQSSYLTQSNHPHQNNLMGGAPPNPSNFILEATSSQYSQNQIPQHNYPPHLQQSTGPFQYSQFSQQQDQYSQNYQQHQQQQNHPGTQSYYSNGFNGQMHPPLQVNSLVGNSGHGESVSNPTLQSSSLHYLSYLSQNLGSQLKQSDQQMTEKYGSGLSSHDNYKVALKSFINKQFERSATSGAHDSGSVQYSRIFRERQSRRLFEQLQNLKTDFVKSYDELESMHTNLLLGSNGRLK